MPCSHTIATYAKLSIDHTQYVSEYFTTYNYIKTYIPILYPLNHIDYWYMIYCHKLKPNTELRCDVGRLVFMCRKKKMDLLQRIPIHCSYYSQSNHTCKYYLENTLSWCSTKECYIRGPVWSGTLYSLSWSSILAKWWMLITRAQLGFYNHWRFGCGSGRV